MVTSTLPSQNSNGSPCRALMIAGGTDGIGFALLTAECYERKKYSKIYVLGRNFGRVQQLKDCTPQIIELTSDITKPNDLSAALARIDEEIHDVVLTIGTFYRGKIKDTSDDDVAKHFHVNCISTIQFLRSIVVKLKPGDSQILVCTASLALAARSPYALQSATKSALRSFVETLREELRGRTRVMNLMPPSVNTQIFAKAGDDRPTTAYPPASRIAKSIQFLLDCPFDICIPQLLIEHHSFNSDNNEVKK